MAKYMSPSVKQDLAKLDKDPDTRRTAMDALKGYVEHLDTKTMPHFLDQVSDTKESEASRPYAISLFVEVARVHRQAVVPFIPTIMSSVVRSLHSSGGSPQLQQACAKVVASVARYTVDPTRPPSYNEEILAGLCDPLLGVLSSKLEPLSGGAATCLQELVESEKWKFASQYLENELCSRGSVALAEKGTPTVAHMQLLRSLAKFNSSILQNFGAQILKAGVRILRRAAEKGVSWQQRASAAQLLSSALGAVDEETLAKELVPTIEALEHCRLDKVLVVRTAIGEALQTAKSLYAEMHSRNRSSCEDASLPSTLTSRGSGSRKPRRQRSLRRSDESPQSKQGLASSQESQVASYSSSPTSFTLSSDSGRVNSPSTARSARLKRSPLNPAKQSRAKPTPPATRSPPGSDLDYILSQYRSADSKENAPVGKKPGAAAETLLSVKLSDDLEGSPEGLVKDTHLPYGGGNGFTEEQEEQCASFSEDYLSDGDGDDGALLFEEDDELAISNEGIRDLEGMGGLVSSTCLQAEEVGNVSVGKKSQDRVDITLGRPNHASVRGGKEHGFQTLPVHDSESYTRGNYVEKGVSNRTTETHQDKSGVPSGCRDPLSDWNTRFNSIAHLVDLGDALSPQRPKVEMTAEDFLLFTTPRRLVRNLQSSSLTPQSKGTPEHNSRESVDMDSETFSESGWSVRDNPIAGDSDEDLPDQSVLVSPVSQKEMIPSSGNCSIEGWSSGMGSREASVQDVPMQGFPLERDAEVVSSSESLSHLRLQTEGTGMPMPKHFNKEGFDRFLSDGSKAYSVSCTLLGQEKCVLRNRERGFPRWLRDVGEKDWSGLVRTVEKAQNYAEVFLGGALCVVLILSIAIAVIKCFNAQDIHVLVPT